MLGDQLTLFNLHITATINNCQKSYYILFLYPDMPLERKTPVAYPDGVYEIAGQDRPNVLLISNITQNGLTGFASAERTGLFIFFGMTKCINKYIYKLALLYCNFIAQ